MPTTYAHDLFGKKIYAKLPAEIQKVIRRNTNLYRNNARQRYDRYFRNTRKYGKI